MRKIGGYMRSALAVVLAAVAVLGAACGGSNPGGGTKTLYVDAQAVSDGSTDGTGIRVCVRDGYREGPVVTNAVVSIRGDRTGEFNLLWEGVDWFGCAAGGYWRAGIAWDSGWALNVRRDNDHLDAYVSAPGITEISQPFANSTFLRAGGQPLVVKWEDRIGRRAETVSIELHQADQFFPLPDDPLQYSIEVNRLVGTGDERLEVTRTNTVTLAGGASGSVFSATTHREIPFIVE
jgi:hypothetical protein